MLTFIVVLLILFMIWFVSHCILRKLGLVVRWPWFSRHWNHSRIVQFFRIIKFNWRNEDPAMIPKQIMIIFICFIVVISIICYVSALLTI